MENETLPLVQEGEAAEEQEEITPEMLQQRQTAIKRLFWVFVVLSLVVVALIIWELVDLRA